MSLHDSIPPQVTLAGNRVRFHKSTETGTIATVCRDKATNRVAYLVDWDCGCASSWWYTEELVVI